MAPAWTAEVVVSESLARELIEGQFPQLAPTRVELLGMGWDNTAFTVNGEFVFRFPRRQFAVQFLEAETRLMPSIAPRLPLPVPAPNFVGHTTEKFPWLFAGYPMIPGRTACAAALNEKEREADAVPLARFLAALHAIPSEEARSSGAIPDTIARLEVTKRVPKAIENLNLLKEKNILSDIAPLLVILEDAPEIYTPTTDTLVHGDLYIRHLLVNENNQISGVIDWGDSHLGDPAIDLAIAHTLLPPSAHEIFRNAYGPISDITWQMARLRALWHTLMVMLYAYDINDQDLIREAHQTLKYTSG
jgi:aminoglycoside phosphotransferase (APT) family kinase protein